MRSEKDILAPPEISFSIPTDGSAAVASPKRGSSNNNIRNTNNNNNNNSKPSAAAAVAPSSNQNDSFGAPPLFTIQLQDAHGNAPVNVRPSTKGKPSGPSSFNASSSTAASTPKKDNFQSSQHTPTQPLISFPAMQEDEEMISFPAVAGAEARRRHTTSYNNNNSHNNYGSNPTNNASLSEHPFSSSNLDASISAATAEFNASTVGLAGAHMSSFSNRRASSFRSASRANLDVHTGEFQPSGRMSTIMFDDKVGARARATMAAEALEQERVENAIGVKRAVSRSKFSNSSGSSSDDEADENAAAQSISVGEVDNEAAAQQSCWELLNKPPVRELVWGKNSLGLKHFRHDSMYIFAPENPIRVFLFNLNKRREFEAVVILLIVCNCIFLAIADPSIEAPEYETNAEFFFTAAFTCEMIIKIIALGFVVHPDSYLREGWNILDFIIVIMSYFTISGLANNFTALRTFRVFRPLRSMNAVKGLKILVGSLIKAIKELIHISTLSLAIIFMFAILGVQLFGNNMRTQCIVNATRAPLNPPVWCKIGVSQVSYWGTGCNAGEVCVDLGTSGNALGSYYSFDNTLTGMLAVFGFSTFEAWTVALTVLTSTSGVITFLYFFVTLIIVGFVLPNLVLAVINYEYVKLQLQENLKTAAEKELAKQRYNTKLAVAALAKQKRSKRLQQSSHAGNSDDDGQSAASGRPGSGDAAGLMMIKNNSNGTLGNPLSYPNSVTHDATSQVRTNTAGSNGARNNNNNAAASDNNNNNNNNSSSINKSNNTNKPITSDVNVDAVIAASNATTDGGLFSLPPMQAGSANEDDFMKDEASHEAEVSCCSILYWGPKWEALRDLMHDITEGFPRPQRRAGRWWVSAASNGFMSTFWGSSMSIGGAGSRRNSLSGASPASMASFRMKNSSSEGSNSSSASTPADSDDDDHRDGAHHHHRHHNSDTPIFGQFIVVMILLNTMVLATQFKDQPQWLDDLQTTCNFIFTIIFTIEMVMKLLALGFKGYFKVAFNFLDCVIVLASLIELGLAGASVVSVFRTLRLLRILKLFKQFPSLRAIVRVTMHAIRKTTYLLLIVGLYLFIVALLGVAIFNTSIEENLVSGNRMTYKNFVHGFLTSFQILAVDGWVRTMYEIMDKTNAAASLFFILQQLIGNFVLLSLFLSILIGSFDDLEGDSELQDDDDIPKGHGEHAVVMKLFDSGELKSVFGRVARKKQGNGDKHNNSDSDDSILAKDADEIPFKFARKTIKLSLEMKREFKRAARHFGVQLPEDRRSDEDSDSNKDEPAYFNNRQQEEKKFNSRTLDEEEQMRAANQVPADQQIRLLGRNGGEYPSMPCMADNGAFETEIKNFSFGPPALEISSGVDTPEHHRQHDHDHQDPLNTNISSNNKVEEPRVEQISSASAAAAHRARLALLRRTREEAAKREEEERRRAAQRDSDNLQDLLRFDDLDHLDRDSNGGDGNNHHASHSVEDYNDGKDGLTQLSRIHYNSKFMALGSAADVASHAGSRLSKDDVFSVGAVAENMAGGGADGNGNDAGRQGVQLAGLDLGNDEDDEDEDDANADLFKKEDPGAIKYTNPEPLTARTLEKHVLSMFGANSFNTSSSLAIAALNGKRHLTVYDIPTEFLKYAKRDENLGADAPLPEVPDMHDMRMVDAHRIETPTTRPRHDAGLAGGGADPNDFDLPLQKTVYLADHKAAAPDPVPVKRRKWCKQCKQHMDAPLPAAPLVVEHPYEYVHKLQCKAICVRKAKERVLGAMLLVVDLYMSVGEAVRYDKVEAIVGQGWQCGMLLGTSVEEIMSAPDVWKALEEELEMQRMVLSLRVGEEELGKSLIGYATKCVPEVHKTNGGVAMWLFGSKNPIRVLISRIVHNGWFETFVYACILMNSITMAISNPLDDPNSTKSNVLEIFNVIFTIIFTIEMVMKLIAFGVVMHPGAYLRDGWNCLDGFIVVISLISDFAGSGVDLGFLQVFRTMRALRPLRVINRNRGLKMVVRTLLESIKGIANVGLIIFIVFLIFAILGVQLFGGLFQSCSDPTRLWEDECWGEWIAPNFERNATSGLPRLVNRTWGSEQRNFDNVAEAFLTLFEVCTGEDWIYVMYRAYDACLGIAVQRNCAVGAGFFFVGFYAVSGFFLIQLFVGVVVHNFRLVKEQLDGSKLLDDEQKLWISTQQLMLNFRPVFVLTPVEGSDLAHWLHHRVLTSVTFDAVIGILIVLNIFSIACDYPSMSATLEQVLEGLNYFFVAVFIIEGGMKLFAYHWRYFESGWNQFDFFLVCISLVGLFLDALSGVKIGVDLNILRVFRIFRILRVLRLVRRARKIKLLLETIYFSLPSLVNVGGFVLLTDFVFGILGVDIFARTYIPPDARVLDEKFANFRSLDNALMMLFRFQTLEDWVGAMRDLMIPEPQAASPKSSGTVFAAVYFLLYVTLCSYVITNLLIAVILDNFETAMKMEDSNVKMNDLHRFVEMWSKHDPEATMQIPTEKLPYLLGQLQTPLGFSRYHSRSVYHLKELALYRIPDHLGYVHFLETLIPLARLAHEQKGKLTKLKPREVREHEEIWKVAFPALRELPFTRFNEHTVTIELYFGATFIAASYRRTIAQRFANQLRVEKINALLDYCAKEGLDETEAVENYTRKVMATTKAKMHLIDNNNNVSGGSDGMHDHHIVSESLIRKQLRLRKRKRSGMRGGHGNGGSSDTDSDAEEKKKLTAAEREEDARRLRKKQEDEDVEARKERETLQLLMVARSKSYSSANSFLSQLKEGEEMRKAQQMGSGAWKRNKSEIIQGEVDERCKEDAKRQRMREIALVSRRRQILKTNANEQLSRALAPENSPAKRGLNGGPLTDEVPGIDTTESGFFMQSASMRMMNTTTNARAGGAGAGAGAANIRPPAAAKPATRAAGTAPGAAAGAAAGAGTKQSSGFYDNIAIVVDQHRDDIDDDDVDSLVDHHHLPVNRQPSIITVSSDGTSEVTPMRSNNALNATMQGGSTGKNVLDNTDTDD